MFEQATKLKLRFQTPRGAITTEDLWDLPLRDRQGVSLDAIAIATHKQIKESEQESFVAKKSKEDKILLLKMEVLKRVIAIRLEDIDKTEKRTANAMKRKNIIDILAEKEENTLKNKSPKVLKDMLAQLAD